MARFVTSVSLLLVLAAGCAPEPSPEADVASRSSSLVESTLSPFCPGQTLSTCPSPRASEWRADIRQMVREGRSNDEIIATLQSRTPGFELRPDRSGLGGYWLVVLIAAIGALGLLVWRFRPRRADAPGGGPEQPAEGGATPEREWDARLDDELRRLDDA